MNVLFVWDADYPWDIRVEKTTDGLIEQGHRVHLVCRNLKRGVPREELNGLSIHRLPAAARLPYGAHYAASFPLFFNPLWAAAIWRTAREIDVDLIIVRDLPLAPTAIAVAKMVGVPVVLDMAECYPEMLRNIWQYGGRSLTNAIVRNPYLADIVERWSVRRCDRVLVMVEESRERLIRMGVSPHRIAIVSNTPDVSRFTPSPAGDERRLQTLLYVGMLNFSRGLQVVIDAVALYKERDPDFRLLIAGTGNAETDLRERVARHNLEQTVQFLGWVSPGDVPGLIAASQVCIVPHRKCSHWEHTLPNKLFDYMAAARPVIASDVRPVRRVLERTHGGLLFDDRDVGTLVAVLRRLENPVLRRTLGRNGRDAIETTYNWEQDKTRFQDVIAALS